MTALLAESALRACVLGGAAWVLLRLLRVRDPARERAAWLAVLLAAAAMPVLLPLLRAAIPHAAPAIRLPPALAADGVENGAAARLAGAYCAIAVLLLARSALGVLVVARMWHGAAAVPELSAGGVPVRCGARVIVPGAAMGGVLLPPGWTRWSPGVLDRVLAHERSHVRRGDFGWMLLARAYRCVFWASPLAWWIERRIALLAEQLSDDAVLDAHPDAPGYAEMLLAFARGPQPRLALGLARRPSLALRIDRILQPGGVVRGRRGRAPVLAAIGAVAAVAVAAPWLAVGTSGPALDPLRGRLAPLDGQLAPLGRVSARTLPAPPSAPPSAPR